MKFTKRNIQRNQKRNKDLVLGGGVNSPSSSISSGGGGASIDTSQYDNHLADKKIHITDEERKKWNEKLDKKTWDDVFTVDGDKLRVKLNVVGEKSVSAHGVGSSSGGGTGSNFNVIDNLISDSTTDALSAKQGKVLKGMIDSKTIDTSNYYNKKDIEDLLLPKADEEYVDRKITALVNGAPETMDTLKELSDALVTNKDAVDAINKSITDKADKTHKHTKADITDLDLSNYDKHLSDTTKHITSTERTNWNDANSKKHSHTNKAVLDTITSDKVSNWDDANKNKHTHINKTVLDGIKSTDITNWNGKLDKSIWDKAFYYDDKNNLRVKLNLIGDKSVSAHGKGDTSSGGIFTVVNNLESDSVNSALSAAMGKELKRQIDTKTVDVDLTDYYKKNETDTLFQPKGNYLSSIPSEYITESELNSKGYLTSHQSLSNYYTKGQVNTELAKKSNTGHTHSQYLTSHQSLSNYYTKGEVNTALGGKSNTGHTHTVVQDAYDNRATTFAYSQPTIGLPTYLAGWNGSELRAVDSNQFWTTANFTTNSINYWNGKANKSDIPSTLPANGGTSTYTNYVNDEGVYKWKMSYAGDGIDSATWLCAFVDGTNSDGSRNDKIQPISPSKLSVNCANSLLPYKKNEGTDKVLISGKRSDNTWSRMLVDDGWRLQFRGIRPQCEGVNIATINDNVSSSSGLKEGNRIWKANYSPTNVKNPTWLCGWNATDSTLEAVDRASLSVSYATTAGSTKTITDGTYGMYLADNGYLLKKGNTYIGSSSDRWNYIYCGNLDASANIVAAGEVTAHSDRRLKSNIKPLENRGAVQPVTYTKDGKECIGFIAQDVKKLYPELVLGEEKENEYLSLDYAQYTAVLQAQLIEQQKQIQLLSSKINTLETKLKNQNN